MGGWYCYLVNVNESLMTLSLEVKKDQESEVVLTLIVAYPHYDQTRSVRTLLLNQTQELSVHP